MGVTPAQLAKHYPRLFHMAECDSWESIQRHGLLCTEALLDLFGVAAEDRRRILTHQRPERIRISHPKNGNAVIRDQKPLSSSKLGRCLKDCSLEQWLQMLNSRVFFWLCRERLETLMCAREYCGQDHLVIILDTLRLTTDFQDKITLTPMNTGNTRPFAHRRGLSTFSRMEDYPFHQRLRLGPYSAVVELAMETGLHNILDYVVEASTMRCSTCAKGADRTIRSIKTLYP